MQLTLRCGVRSRGEVGSFELESGTDQWLHGPERIASIHVPIG